MHCSSGLCSPSRDIMCGKLFCTGGQEMPTYGSLVTFESCKASFPRDGEGDLGMILNGTKCGDGMVSRDFFFLFLPSFSLISLAFLPDKKDFKPERLKWMWSFC